MRAAWGAVAAVVLAPRVAAAEETASCGHDGRPGITLRAGGIDPELRARIAQQLRAALAARRFALCSDEASRVDAVAELDVSGALGGSSENVAVTLSLRDEITDKRVSRDIDLRRIPEDGRPLAIAQAADELLRASWAELLVADARRPTRAVPAEVTEAVSSPDAPTAHARARGPVVEVGASAAVETFGSGHTQVGPDVAVSVFPRSRVGAVARAGIRTAGSDTGVAGRVDVDSTVFGVAIVAALLQRGGALGVDVGPELFFTRVSYDAEPSAGARGRSDAAAAVHASVVARGWVVVAAPLRATMGLALGAPIHTVRAVADDTSITGVSGLLVGLHAGVGGGW